MAPNLTKKKQVWKPVAFKKSGFEIVPDEFQLEEEKSSTFCDGDYYPVEIGDVLAERYQVLGKLGWGISSTVWLTSDLIECKYFVLKIFKRDVDCQKELQFYEEQKRIDSKHAGRECMRNLVRAFELTREGKTHTCLVFVPLGRSAMSMFSVSRNGRIPESGVKGIVARTLKVLDYLHQECRAIHTDIKPDNILFPLDDDKAIAEFVKEEVDHPSPRKVVDGKTVYMTRRFKPTKNLSASILCDFGSFEHGDSERNHHAQPDFFRSPEVTLQANWSYPVDIWNVATMAWVLLEGAPLFHGYGTLTGEDDDDMVIYLPQCHLAEMMSILGPPPLDLIKRGKKSSEYFEEDGTCKIEKWRMPPRETLEDHEKVLKGKSRKQFLDFIRCALAWRPEDRKTAAELLSHPWIKTHV